MRRWLSRAQELEDEPLPPDCPEHCKRILKGKNLKLFSEILEFAGNQDKNIVSDICKGFDLLGPLPKTGIMPSKLTVATLTPQDVKDASDTSRLAIWNSTRKCVDDDLCKDVYRLTLEERDSGWLKGPLSLEDLPQGATLTRRFGVSQSSSHATLGKVRKVRPIDDFTESLVNLSNASEETISPQGVDTIAAAISYRIQKGRKLGMRESLEAKTIDLKKAYKQLPVSSASLLHSYLCVRNPDSGSPEAFQSFVLPFGARAAVQGFCRAAVSLWWVGVVVFWFHWSAFFDDYFLVEASECKRHCDLMQRGLFSLLGWETSVDKEAEFSLVAKALGVQISLSDAKSGLLTVGNTQARKEEVGKDIDAVLAGPFVQGSRLVSLRGRLLFAESQVFGRKAALKMKVLSAHCNRKPRVFLNTELREALAYLKDRVLNAPPRVINSQPRNVYHLYTDACHEESGGGLGAIMYDTKGVMYRWFSAWLSPEDLSRIDPEGKQTLIFELEAMAAIWGALNLGKTWKHCDAIIFCDNEAVLSCLIRGRSDSSVVNRLLESLLRWETENDVTLWFERVPSKSNPADLPSRDPECKLAGLQCHLPLKELLSDLC
jgi:hypothetical protein